MATSIATAYLTLVPKMQNGWKTDVGNAVTPGLQSVGDDAGGKAGDSFSKAMAGSIKSLTKSAVVVKAAKGFADLFGESLSSFSDRQQFLGGVETLFGKDAQAVIDSAKQAYKTAGVSANDYMEQTISTAASMVKSLGGDTKQAAELSDMAIRDMADNVNKMGTSMDSVQAAYVAMTRGNYTLLDNLALGFAGTKEGAQELIDKANELAKQNGETANLSIDSYADMVRAIHIVQNEMKITGTTALEAQTTISGSYGMLKSDWQNLVAAFGDPDADVAQIVDNVIDDVGRLAVNVAPVAGRIISGIAQGLAGGAATLSGALNDVIVNAVGQWLGLNGMQVSNAMHVGMLAQYGLSDSDLQAGGGFDNNTGLPLTNAAAPTTNNYIINGVTYDDGSAASNAVQQLVEAIIVDERS